MPILKRAPRATTILPRRVWCDVARAGLFDCNDPPYRFTIGGRASAAFIMAQASTLRWGDANDGFRKDLSGGRIVGHPPVDRASHPKTTSRRNVAASNGANERRGVHRWARQARASRTQQRATHAVVEGVVDHGCEYLNRRARRGARANRAVTSPRG